MSFLRTQEKNIKDMENATTEARAEESLVGTEQRARQQLMYNLGQRLYNFTAKERSVEAMRQALQHLQILFPDNKTMHNQMIILIAQMENSLNTDYERREELGKLIGSRELLQFMTVLLPENDEHVAVSDEPETNANNVAETKLKEPDTEKSELEILEDIIIKPAEKADETNESDAKPAKVPRFD